MPHATPHRQRGAAALTTTLVLFFVMTLVAAFANRSLVFEQRISANQYRAAQAFEAAEAGLEWALAMLNDPQRVGDDCRPTEHLPSASFRERHLHFDAATGVRVPMTWVHAGHAVALQASCVRDTAGWSCSCPAGGFPELSAPSADGPHPAFSIALSSAPQAGLLRLTATGCTSLGGACLPGSSSVPDASAQAQLLLGLVPGLAMAPAAPLTVKDSVDAGSAALGLHNPYAASGGLTIHAGGSITAPNAHVSTVAGGSATASWVEADTALAALPPDRLFAGIFGVDKATWKEQSMVGRVSCDAGCPAMLAQASTHQLLWVDGDLSLDGPVILGTAERPVVVVVSGSARLNGAVTIHGLVYAHDIVWNDAGGGTALLRGAAISETDYRGNGAPDFVYDAAVLAALKGETGSFARVPGSWKDF